ncbi:hypothetical protein SAMN05216327_109197 [Dyadobacter sp. SG02]|uniref:hypothetical protein n=1 Tax=Dyadobacter sp. SG02 TaxID=1855291 RepID=UPI0008D6E182|nr:hypothetical protein [Dyadobacter sp. SG02]SEJ39022.1 hypothetical protein SAMN05216327_109197 [Dyadobacter sp. SG02]
MVIISLAASLSLFALYNLCLCAFPPVAYRRHDPVERCEEFVYGSRKHEAVLVGSGLLGQLESGLSQGFFNLCFPYFGSTTGVEIIVLSQKKPDWIFIEANYIFKETDKNLIVKLFTGPWRKIKRFVPAFRKKNRPVALLRNALGYLKKTKKTTPARLADGDELERFIRIYNQPPDLARLEDHLEKFKTNLNTMRSRGCRIAFFEMPVHESLRHSRLFEWQRQRLNEIFAREPYHWITGGQQNEYQTIDGIHLTEESAARYTGYLMQEVRTLLT